MFSTDDTIAALATPPGRGGLGVVRISGPAAAAIAAALTGRSRAWQPRRATFTRVRGRAAEPPTAAIDEVVCTYFPAPRSYTGEDVVEISAHGSPVVLSAILAESMRLGARLANPGEFTFRAYLHGRVNLVQAEAVADLIDAVTPVQARQAYDQLEGTLTGAICEVEHIVFDLIVMLEASLDFPEENYHFISQEGLGDGLRGARQRIDELLGTAGRGRLIREGAQVVIAGRPNVGKSSLFNALVGSGRAIVTALPGTTRDLLTERCDIDGIPVTLVDTAGVREALDEVEQEGVARARRARDAADLTVIVVDGSQPLTPGDRELASTQGSRVVVAVNKCDLPAAWDLAALRAEASGAIVTVSAKTGSGIPDFRRALVHQLGAGEPLRDRACISNVRHVRLLEQARAAVAAAIEAVERGATEEFVLADLREATMAFDQVVGRRTPDDVLATIFSRFCIGK